MGYQHGHDHPGSTTVIDDRNGAPAGVVAAIAVVVVAALIWLFVFSGLVFDGNDNNPSQPNIEQNFEQNAPDQQAPPQQQDQPQDQQPQLQPSG